MRTDIEQTVGKILDALILYKNELVVIGGICASIYHREKQEDISNQLFTTDLDLAASGKDIKKALNITDCLSQLDMPYKKKRARNGKTVFELDTGEGQIFELEFLVPEKGSKTGGTSVLQPGVIGEKLRYIDLLFHNAEMIELEIGGRDVEFQRPKPGVFIAHRSLAVEKRSEDAKKKKDYAYIVNLIHLFSDQMERLGQDVSKAKKHSAEHEAWINKAAQYLSDYFLDQRDPLIYATERTGIEERQAQGLVNDFLDMI